MSSVHLGAGPEKVGLRSSRAGRLRERIAHQQRCVVFCAEPEILKPIWAAVWRMRMYAPPRRCASSCGMDVGTPASTLIDRASRCSRCGTACRGLPAVSREFSDDRQRVSAAEHTATPRGSSRQGMIGPSVAGHPCSSQRVARRTDEERLSSALSHYDLRLHADFALERRGMTGRIPVGNGLNGTQYARLSSSPTFRIQIVRETGSGAAHICTRLSNASSFALRAKRCARLHRFQKACHAACPRRIAGLSKRSDSWTRARMDDRS